MFARRGHPCVKVKMLCAGVDPLLPPTTERISTRMDDDLVLLPSPPPR